MGSDDIIQNVVLGMNCSLLTLQKTISKPVGQANLNLFALLQYRQRLLDRVSVETQNWKVRKGMRDWTCKWTMDRPYVTIEADSQPLQHPAQEAKPQPLCQLAPNGQDWSMTDSSPNFYPFSQLWAKQSKPNTPLKLITLDALLLAALQLLHDNSFQSEHSWSPPSKVFIFNCKLYYSSTYAYSAKCSWRLTPLLCSKL